MLLDLEDVRQRESDDCGRAVYRTVMKFYGIRQPPPHVDPLGGMHPAYLAAALRLAGLKVCEGEMDEGDLKYHCNRGRPVIALIHHEGFGHYVTVRGVDRNKVYYQCPILGRCSLRVDNWRSVWYDLDRSGLTFRHWGASVWQ